MDTNHKKGYSIVKGVMISVEEWDFVKEKIGKRAAELVPDHGIIGLGSGSTCAMFVRALADRYKRQRLDITCIPASKSTEHLARDCGLPVFDGYAWDHEVTIAFDGADAVDTSGTAIKGAGGDLLREKVVVSAAKQVVLMVDERKWNLPFHKAILPVAVVPFGWKVTEEQIRSLGFPTTLRIHADRSPVITDDSLYIFDLTLQQGHAIEKVHERLKQLTGVVETGVFHRCASLVLVGHRDGHVESIAAKHG